MLTYAKVLGYCFCGKTATTHAVNVFGSVQVLCPRMLTYADVC
jgi:hypothetical protein